MQLYYYIQQYSLKNTELEKQLSTSSGPPLIELVFCLDLILSARSTWKFWKIKSNYFELSTNKIIFF